MHWINRIKKKKKKRPYLMFEYSYDKNNKLKTNYFTYMYMLMHRVLCYTCRTMFFNTTVGQLAR